MLEASGEDQAAGVEGSLSVSFVPMILSAMLISLPEIVLIAAAATLVQATTFVREAQAASDRLQLLGARAEYPPLRDDGFRRGTQYP